MVSFQECLSKRSVALIEIINVSVLLGCCSPRPYCCFSFLFILPTVTAAQTLFFFPSFTLINIFCDSPAKFVFMFVMSVKTFFQGPLSLERRNNASVSSMTLSSLIHSHVLPNSCYIMKPSSVDHKRRYFEECLYSSFTCIACSEKRHYKNSPYK